MLNTRSLRFRLIVWYVASVFAICLLAATGYWFAIRAALDHALDQGLRYRLTGLRTFLAGVEPASREQLHQALEDVSQLGELYQAFDADGTVIAESQGLSRHGVPRHAPLDVGADIRFSDGGTGEFPLRIASQRALVGGREVILRAADPRRKFEGIQTAFTTVLLGSTPVIVALALGGGVWLGRRALAPVARITSDARAITDSNLSARLAVPRSRDELQLLSETLNEMLGRIERSFTRTRQFTADASHELRAPLTLILAAAEYSLRRERSREDLVDSLRKILREAQRTTALIDDLLMLARGDAGGDATPPAVVDAVPIVRDVAEQGAALGAAKAIAVELQLEAAALPVAAHERQLRRLLLILIDNALKYTSAGGRVTVTAAAAEASGTRIAVADTGVGIAPEDLPHVFERFWRADKVRSRDEGGTGLGLAIARQIADQHGAALTVDSEVGRGSTFTLGLK
jgi:signal transduction histidine kinase